MQEILFFYTTNPSILIWKCLLKDWRISNPYTLVSTHDIYDFQNRTEFAAMAQFHYFSQT